LTGIWWLFILPPNINEAIVIKNYRTLLIQKGGGNRPCEALATIPIELWEKVLIPAPDRGKIRSGFNED